MRAALKLRDDSAYIGEVWEPKLDSENYHTVAVTIDVQSPGDASASDPQSLQVLVTAKLDSFLDSDGPMQRSHQFTFQRTN